MGEDLMGITADVVPGLYCAISCLMLLDHLVFWGVLFLVVTGLGRGVGEIREKWVCGVSIKT